MDKAPQPSLWGLLFIVAILIVCIVFGPQKEPPIDTHVQNSIDCSTARIGELNPTQLELCIDLQRGFERIE